MNLDAVIGQLKSLAPIFNGNVAGAAQYATGVLNAAWLPLPSAYVMPGDTSGSDNDSLTALYQTVIESAVIVVVFDNSTDRRGQSVASQYDLVRAQIRRSILNWRPGFDPADRFANNAPRGFREAAGELLDMDRARIFYQWTYEIETVITFADGWQLPSDPLVDIQATISTDRGTETFVADIPLPQ